MRFTIEFKRFQGILWNQNVITTNSIICWAKASLVFLNDPILHNFLIDSGWYYRLIFLEYKIFTSSFVARFGSIAVLL